jgi:hypothetical protein
MSTAPGTRDLRTEGEGVVREEGGRERTRLLTLDRVLGVAARRNTLLVGVQRHVLGLSLGSTFSLDLLGRLVRLELLKETALAVALRAAAKTHLRSLRERETTLQ